MGKLLLYSMLDDAEKAEFQRLNKKLKDSSNSLGDFGKADGYDRIANQSRFKDALLDPITTAGWKFVGRKAMSLFYGLKGAGQIPFLNPLIS